MLGATLVYFAELGITPKKAGYHMLYRVKRTQSVGYNDKPTLCVLLTRHNILNLLYLEIILNSKESNKRVAAQNALEDFPRMAYSACWMVLLEGLDRGAVMISCLDQGPRFVFA